MSVLSSITGDASTTSMPAKIRNLYQSQKPDIAINLTHKRSTYTTLDQLDGLVQITAPHDIRFDDIEIEFVGTSRTYVERLTTTAAISGRSEAFHQFLKLQQPRMQQHYPADKVLRAGQTYQFPFLFVVPQHLLPRVCQHAVASPSLRDQHLQLPPSFGDRDATAASTMASSLSQQGGSGTAHVLDDMVPDMASIRYGIFTRISRDKPSSSSADGAAAIRTTLASKARRLRIIPVSDEMPPLDISVSENEQRHHHQQRGSGGSDYTPRREKTIRKGVLRGKLGTLVLEAAQPPAIRLRARGPRNDDGAPPQQEQPSVATILLRFDPADAQALPPRLGSLTTKLKALTFFACTARTSAPSKHASYLDLSQGLHSEQVGLSARCVANVEWTRHEASSSSNKPEGSPPPLAPERRDSAFSLNSLSAPTPVPAPSKAYKPGSPFYLARLLVPLSLPTGGTSSSSSSTSSSASGTSSGKPQQHQQRKIFAPTFHSCLISRVYQLKLELGLAATAQLAGTVDLKLPLQICCDAPLSAAGMASPPRRVSAPLEHSSSSSPPPGLGSEDEDVAHFFEARTLHVPAAQFVGRSRIGSQPLVGAEHAAAAAGTGNVAGVEVGQEEEDEAPPDYAAAFAPAWTARA